MHLILKNSIFPPFPNNLDEIHFGMGCFWGVERLFWETDGVWSSSVGYAGGNDPSPNYEKVCSGDTGHAEVIKCEYNEKKISLEKILNIFFLIHDPTQLNRQGNDIGSQYRSAIFLSNLNQMKIVELSLAKAKKFYTEKIYTEIASNVTFFPAEDYHQDYYKKNRNSGYCNILIPPKLKKLKEEFSEDFKEYI